MATSSVSLLIALACTSPPDDTAAAVEDLVPSHHDVVRTRGAHGLRVTAAFPVPAALDVACALDADPDEVHLYALPPALDHDLAVRGLLAEHSYTCTLASDAWTARHTVTTGAPPPWIPTWQLQEDVALWGAYNLVSHRLGLEDQKLLIIDIEGRLRWSMLVPENPVDIDATWLEDEQLLLMGGGYKLPPTLVSLSGETIARGPESSTGRPYHHHVERTDDGSYLAMSLIQNTDGANDWTGFTVEQIDPDLSETVWVWSSQDGVDQGRLDVPGGASEDPYHANALALHGDAIYINLYGSRALVELDRTTGEVGWLFGPGRDFTLLDDRGEVADASAWQYTAHAPERRGSGWLFYDNGGGRPGGGSSRVVEFLLDEATMTAQTLWTWTEPGWFEPIWGDVDWLDNGGVFVDRAHHSSASDDQRTELIELDPTDHLPTWRLRFHGGDDFSYRAERLGGCAIFANAHYCPALLDR